jgi:hypothetical protein
MKKMKIGNRLGIAFAFWLALFPLMPVSIYGLRRMSATPDRLNAIGLN